jgi:inosose dehydratase
MKSQVSRRRFIQDATLATTGLALAGVSSVSAATRIRAAPGDIKFGYAAITWQGQDRQAIEDVAAVGFTGIQLRTTVLPEFGDKAAALKELLAKHGLIMVAFSSGGVRIDPGVEAEDIATHTRHARFVRDVGGQYLQLTDTRPKRRTADD